MQHQQQKQQQQQQQAAAAAAGTAAAAALLLTVKCPTAIFPKINKKHTVSIYSEITNMP
jgi:hemoglobin-like flavoprotein